MNDFKNHSTVSNLSISTRQPNHYDEKLLLTLQTVRKPPPNQQHTTSIRVFHTSLHLPGSLLDRVRTHAVLPPTVPSTYVALGQEWIAYRGPQGSLSHLNVLVPLS
jgi:hypothetical protein